MNYTVPPCFYIPVLQYSALSPWQHVLTRRIARPMSYLQGLFIIHFHDYICSLQYVDFEYIYATLTGRTDWLTDWLTD
jgi:hypothetical protein